MKRFLYFPFVFILLLTVVSLVINFSQSYEINIGPYHFKTPAVDLTKININRDLNFRRGLDLEGGTSVTLRADMSTIPASQRDNALDSAKNVIERRVNL